MKPADNGAETDFVRLVKYPRRFLPSSVSISHNSRLVVAGRFARPIFLEENPHTFGVISPIRLPASRPAIL